ncbi:calcium-binding protein [Herbaspirillum huttiense]|uniref:calcium-binding protein n=1 Tax=Herbaspirillum huttiense TaxID=863372 RepID=UPI002176EDCB|nr:calcium-binding protein [Herbaspirillum huttiense]UWE14291.1 hypothetical protein NY669_14285 [Herbaspirillum huttiense]
MSTNSSSKDQRNTSSDHTEPVITRIDDRFVKIRTGSVFKIAYAPISHAMKLQHNQTNQALPATAKPGVLQPRRGSKPAGLSSTGSKKTLGTSPAGSDHAMATPAPIHSARHPGSAGKVVLCPPISAAPEHAPAATLPKPASAPASISRPAASSGHLRRDLGGQHHHHGGRPASEKDVVSRAIKENLCDNFSPSVHARGGTSSDDLQTLLKEFGFSSSLSDGFDVATVAQSIKDGKGISISVNANRLWGMPSGNDTVADHRITVTGVACAADNGEVKGFYIADSGRSNIVDMSRFLTVAQIRNATNVRGADTLTTDESIKLSNQNLDATGNDLANILVGNRGNNVLTGGKGNDLLIGGAGNDSYRFARGDGQDTVYDHDASKANVDTLSFTAARQDNLWLSQVGKDLRIKVLGTTDQVTVKDWYVGGSSGTDNHIERIQTADGKVLNDTDVEKLVQAMASFAPPTATQTNWAEAQGGNGKLLLAVSH